MKGLNKKMGPLPVWAWGLILGTLGYFLYERSKNAAASTSSTNSPTATVLDPNQLDPNTGLTYGQEEGAALSGTFPTSGSLGSSTDTSGASGIDQFDSDLASFLQAQTDFTQLAGALGFQPPHSTPTNTTPVTNAHPPTTKPSVHYSATMWRDVTKVQTTIGDALKTIGKAGKAPHANAQATRAQSLLNKALNASTPSQQNTLLKQAQTAATKAKNDAAGALKARSDSKNKKPPVKHSSGGVGIKHG
ncbi:MAG TPA: hypothetical protein VFI54_06325 [Solirubrobacteraceae bacterium]|nr:hypothetical protein [Solirubrobacteraceae bacterium]